VLMVDRVVLVVVIRIVGEVVFRAGESIVEGGFAIPT